ncbi:MAG: dihydrolipoyl dehydrogenase family protein [Alphaproteobacteria bacterium]
MSRREFDLAIIGAGSGGLVAADFAARVGVSVALIERQDVGGDCTWTGCVPSKALVKAAKVAHQIRNAARFGVTAGEPQVDMVAVRDGIRRAVRSVYERETPEVLARRGITVVKGNARFVDSRTLDLGDQTIVARKIVIATGAHAAHPDVAGLDEVPFATYETIFDNDRLPDHLVVIGGGPIGAELAQAYRRLGARVTMVAPRLLPREDEETRQTILRVFEREGMHCHYGRAQAVRRDGDHVVVTTDAQEELRGDFLLVATGRRPNVAGLNLAAAGVIHTAGGIPVDRRMRTNIGTIYAAGDVVGGPQFTHFAGWQGFHAARAALLPGGGGELGSVPRITFTDPEVAHIGPELHECRALYGDTVETRRMEFADLDRAIADQESEGFIRIVTRNNGAIVAATVVGPHAGETLGELVLAITNRVSVGALAATLHAYPTYASGVQQLAVDLALDRSQSGFSGRITRWLAGGRGNASPDGTASPLQPEATPHEQN